MQNTTELSDVLQLTEKEFNVKARKSDAYESSPACIAFPENYTAQRTYCMYRKSECLSTQINTFLTFCSMD